MGRKDVDDYIQQGIYGQKEINPDERRKYLGTLRERIVIALTQVQVREEGTYPEVLAAMKSNPEAKLLLNGHIAYDHLSKYTKHCNKLGIEYTMVTNKEHNSEIGLILTYDYAIDKEDIFIKKKPSVEVEEEKKGMFSFISNLFRND